jgi:hypothetical protein
MNQFTSAPDAKRFVTAGNAVFTLSSRKTGARYTYKVQAPKDDMTDGRRFVKLLTGPDNMDDYTYLGMIDRSGEFRLTRASKLTLEAASVRAVKYFCDIVLVGEKIPDALEVRHEGRCGRCNRRLTVPESIDRGIGPECAGMMGMV